MPKEKKVKKVKVVKNPKSKTKQKQKQSVNVNVKIDNSRKTNPRQPNQNKNNVSRFTGNSQTPLHTTIMTASPSPAIIQQEPNFAQAVNNLFKDAEMKTNRQLTLLNTDIEDRQDYQNKLINQILLKNTPYNPSQVYDDLIQEHQIRNQPPPPVKTPTRYRTPLQFEDINEAVKNKLQPADDYEGDNEGEEESKEEPKVLQETKEDEPNIPVFMKKSRGRPAMTEDEKQARAEQQQKEKEQKAFQKQKAREAREEQKRKEEEMTKSSRKLEKEKQQKERHNRIIELRAKLSARKKLRGAKLVLEPDSQEA